MALAETAAICIRCVNCMCGTYMHVYNSVLKGNFEEFESQELSFVGDLVSVLSLHYLAFCS